MGVHKIRRIAPVRDFRPVRASNELEPAEFLGKEVESLPTAAAAAAAAVAQGLLLRSVTTVTEMDGALEAGLVLEISMRIRRESGTVGGAPPPEEEGLHPPSVGASAASESWPARAT